MAISFAKSENKRTKPLKPLSAKPDAPIKARRGPKPTGKAKQPISLRLDPDIISHYRSSGDGWQRRLNDDLRKIAGLTPSQ